MKRKDGYEIRTDEDQNWSKEEQTPYNPTERVHNDNNKEESVMISSLSLDSRWQDAINIHRPDTRTMFGYVYPRIKLFDNGILLPKEEQVSGAPVKV